MNDLFPLAGGINAVDVARSGHSTNGKARFVAASIKIWASLFLLCAAGQAQAQLPAQRGMELENLACGKIYMDRYGPYDYRDERDKLKVVEEFHFSRNVEFLIKGITAHYGQDLNYTLLSSPNHHRALVAAVAGKFLAHPSVNYVATLPGSGGTGAAFLGEVAIALILMSVVLLVSNTQKLARFTGLFAGACVAAFITFEAPISGMSMNPARTFGSAVLPQLWDSLWIYFLAPPLGMLVAAAVHLRLKHAVGCAKLHHQNKLRCIFCEYQAAKQKAIQLDKSVKMSLPLV